MNTFIPTRKKRIDLSSDFAKYYQLQSTNEQILYSHDIPYSLVKQEGIDLIVSPHFSDTLEILISCGAEGNFTLNTKPTHICSNSIIFILPHVIHGGRLSFPNNGYLFNFKISLNNIKHFLNIENFMNMHGYLLENLTLSRPDYALVIDELKRLILVDNDLYERNIQILRLFNLFEKGIPENPSKTIAADQQFTCLYELLTWTEKHFQEHISLEDAAKITHLSRCYFSRYFKEKTGFTYFQYLNQVRISYAIECLLTGKTTIETCYESGFHNVSYFIQQFKKITGYTTQEYLDTIH